MSSNVEPNSSYPESPIPAEPPSKDTAAASSEAPEEPTAGAEVQATGEEPAGAEVAGEEPADEEAKRNPPQYPFMMFPAYREARVRYAVQSLLAQIEAEDPSLRISKEDAWADVAPALADRAAIVRQAVVDSMIDLGYLPDNTLVEELLRKDPAPEVRASAAEVLGKLGNTSSLAALFEALVEEDYQVRAAAALAIARLGDGSHLPLIRERLAAETHPVPAAELLVTAWRLGDESAARELIAMIPAVDDDAAVEFLYTMECLANEQTPPTLGACAADLARALMELGWRTGLQGHASIIEKRLIELAALAEPAESPRPAEPGEQAASGEVAEPPPA